MADGAKIYSNNADIEFGEFDLTSISPDYGFAPTLTPVSSGTLGNLGIVNARQIIQVSNDVMSSSYTLTNGIGSGLSVEYVFGGGNDFSWLDSAIQIYDTDNPSRLLYLTLGGNNITTNPTFSIYGYLTATNSPKYIQLGIQDSDDYAHLTREDTNVLGLIIDMPLRVTTDTNTYLQTDHIDVDLGSGTNITMPILSGVSYSNTVGFPFPYAIGINDRVVIFDKSGNNLPEVVFANTSLGSAGGIGANLSGQYMWVNWNLHPKDNNSYSLGTSDLSWVDGYFTSTIYVPEIDSSAGGATDLTITTGSEKTLVLTTPVYDDLMVQAGNVRLPASAAPAYTAYKGSEVLAFSKSATNTIYFTAQVPHNYVEGTDLEFHIHIAYPSNGAGNSIWYFTYSWANMGANFPAESNSGNITVASPTTTDRHQYGELIATISGNGKTISSVLLCSLSRIGGNGSDTYDDVIYLVGADFHHQINTLGSRQQAVK